MGNESQVSAGAMDAKLKKQLDVWRRDLVALDRRQRLLYFKHMKTGSLEIMSPSPAAVLGRVTAGDVRISPEIGPTSTTSRDVVAEGKNETELRGGLRRLDYQSHQVFADRGLWTLYLGLGMLQWVDQADGKEIHSPVVLVPVNLTRAAANLPYVMSRTDGDPVLNPVLALKMESDFGLTLPEVDPDDFELSAIFAAVSAQIRDLPTWSLVERTVLATFSFHKEAIYQDLREHESSVLASPLVQLVALGPDSPSAREFAFDPISDDNLDTQVPPETLHHVLDADSTQRRCVIAARQGKSFVMDGPPGTGKSQTIANIIAELMAAGRSVLFVSEKAAALDVVRNRLESVNLAEFVLELHSSSTTRKQFAELMGAALNQRIRLDETFHDQDAGRLRSSRTRLSDYADAVNEVRAPLGRSLHWALGQLARSHGYDQFQLPFAKRWAGLDANAYGDLCEQAQRLSRSWGPVTRGEEFLWRDVVIKAATPPDLKRHRTTAEAARRALTLLVERSEAIDTDLGLTLQLTATDVDRRVELLQLAEDRPNDALTNWVTSATTADLKHRVETLRSSTADFNSTAAHLEAAVGPQWNQLPVDDVDVAAGALASHAAWSASRTTTTSQLESVLALTQIAPERLAPIVEDARRLAAVFGIAPERLSTNRVTDLTRLAELASRTALPEAAWFNPAVAVALAESQRVLAMLVDLVVASQKRVSSTFTPEVLELDLNGLLVRFREVHVGLHRWSSSSRADRKLLKTVAVRRKVDKVLIAALDDALAWQEAERALTRGESDHASHLGSYYHRTETDFGRVSDAIAVAQEAISLAGRDLNTEAVAEQLALSGAPDPLLLATASRAQEAVVTWESELATVLGADAAAKLSRTPILALAEGLLDLGQKLEASVGVLTRTAATAARDLTIDESLGLLSKGARASKLHAELLDSFAADVALVGPGYDGAATDWAAVDTGIAWAERVRKVADGPLSPFTAKRLWSATFTAAEISSLAAAWQDAENHVLALFGRERAAQLAAEVEEDLVSGAILFEVLAADAEADVDEWCEFRRLREWFDDHGVSAVIDEAVSSRTPAKELPTVVERAIHEAWADAIIAADDRLEAYRARDRDALVADFRHLDARLISERSATVIAACNDRRPRSNSSRAVALIQRQAQIKSRHKPIRELLREVGDVAVQLKPCFMMSPLAVSQYLPATMRFDVVIFDEASQVLPSDAINCIYRADQLIVAGDVKQLPPTSFFTSAVADDETLDDEDDEALDTFQSLLDLCKAAGSMPSLPLSWHYRSDHESLITFSNYSFYKGELYTFPGAAFDGEDVGVASFITDGVYRRGSSRDNPVEAEAVVDRVLHHTALHPHLSLGVVTFSSAQEDAIYAALERRAASQPVLSDLLNSHDRLNGFFVKNLENVQGDERDIIIFSVGYGPDENGKLTNTFGPLNKAGGWRRLNVAVTRARRRVEVVSSFNPDQMPTSANDGVRYLKRYLDYARRGIAALGLDLTESLGDAESPFEEDVIREIRALGYDAVPQVGTAGYRIDIGVKHPDYPGKFLLAVECDGAAYHSSKVARDRDRLREGVLRRLGWNVFRIWGISWVRDREAQIERLRATLEGALAEDGSSRTAPQPAAMGPVAIIEEVDLSAPPEWGVAYTTGGSYRRWSDCEPGSPSARLYIKAYLEAVIAAEAPVHQETIDLRFREHWDVGRIGSLIRENLNQALAHAQVRDKHVKKDSQGFVRVSGEEIQNVRLPLDRDDIRRLRHVPPEEISLAVRHIMRDVVVADVDDIVRLIARAFGWNVNLDLENVVGSAVSQLVASGVLLQSDGGLLRLEVDAS
jgi:very-short-patch-repair endonuclease